MSTDIYTNIMRNKCPSDMKQTAHMEREFYKLSIYAKASLDLYPFPPTLVRLTYIDPVKFSRCCGAGSNRALLVGQPRSCPHIEKLELWDRIMLKEVMSFNITMQLMFPAYVSRHIPLWSLFLQGCQYLSHRHSTKRCIISENSNHHR